MAVSFCDEVKVSAEPDQVIFTFVVVGMINMPSRSFDLGPGGR
jgi:hypothetical protein